VRGARSDQRDDFTTTNAKRTKMSKELSRLAMLGVLILQGACSGNNSSDRNADGGNMSGAITCGDGEFRIHGTLAGQAINIQRSSAGGGYWRMNPAGFASQASNLAIDPTKTRLDLEWTDDIMKDQFPATGKLLMGTSDVLASKQYCLGTGTQVDFANDDLRFVLKGITEAPGCQAPVEGDLAGCFM
jgi:hypothetical protein